MTSDPKLFAVYMMSNCKHGVLYTGVTSNLPNRATQHREGTIEGFTKKYQRSASFGIEPTMTQSRRSPSRRNSSAGGGSGSSG
jgi:predicted GIY-YIG superfamily endonuclease